LSLSLSVCLSVSVCLPLCPLFRPREFFVPLTVCLSLSVCLFVCLPLYPRCRPCEFFIPLTVCLSVCLSAAVSLMSTTWVLCPCLYVCLSNCLSSVSLSLSVISLCVCATWVTDSYRPPTMSCFSAFRCIYLSLSVFGLFFCLSVCLSVSFSFWQSVSVNWINLCSKYWDSYGVVGFTLHVTHCRWFQGRLIIWVIWPNQQCHNSERPGHGQIDHAQLTKR